MPKFCGDFFWKICKNYQLQDFFIFILSNGGFFRFWKRFNFPRLTLLLTFPFWITNADRCTQNLKLWFSAVCKDWIYTFPKFCLLETRVYVHAATPGNFFKCATHLTVQAFDAFHYFIKNFHTMSIFRHV